MKTVFILDSDASQQKVMSQHFKAIGFEVRSFENASEFDAVKEKPFLVILDEKMEGKSKSGIQFLKLVARKMSGVPVVYMVNRTESNAVSEAEKNGAFQVIEKNSAAFVNLRTALDRLLSAPPRSNWFMRLFSKQSSMLPALV